MTDALSSEQRKIVNLPLIPITVTACAGSGKTKTAVHRLAAMRQMYDGSGLVALLSFSNVAVDTFRKEYSALSRRLPTIGRSSSVEIDTIDGFITSNVLRPHGHRVMKCDRIPYLVEGHEGFLARFKVYDGKISRSTASIDITSDGKGFRYTIGRGAKVIPENRAEAALTKLAAVGAYTHSSGRYWVLRTLREKSFVLRALARRYPHILIDEAQDIGPEHQAFLQLLIDAGSQISLIGDPNQAIYEFAHANGTFLRDYGTRPGVSAYNLTVNYRSLPAIVDVANHLTQRNDTAARKAAKDQAATYYMPFKETERDHALTSFRSLMETATIRPAQGVVLCRSKSLADKWAGELDGQGIGVVRWFADAAISRDLKKNYYQSFVQVCQGIVGLLSDKHGSIVTYIVRPTDNHMRSVRKIIWLFMRDAATGLPPATLVANNEWHHLLSTRVQALIAILVTNFGFEAAQNLGRRLAKTKLEARPLIAMPSLTAAIDMIFRTSTVHKVKGESLEAVLYVAQKGHVRALLDGTSTEEGRIGYVALTRARNLFVLGVPDSCVAEFEAELHAAGLQRVGFREQPIEPLSES
ncbi:UvrD-helicase domain-containing protein [Komagataeibacter intermedius]|uniref:DNA 3'-5' helicase II n=1 Tax=Komagataeibacter intermedius AF2 TaxID=1458464 RepID=A0A0N1FJL0_9PROT|nr:ATP-dependent helicase [Komagataeibacter intermedius]KPH85975.1 DNA helicase II UvrD/Rep [Komagataeibacter intermedius AF2]